MISKVAILTAARQVEIVEKNIEIQPDEVLLKVEVCGLCNWERGFFTGELLNDKTSLPMQLGHEIAGTVCEIGSAVTDLKIGDRVTPLPDRLNGFAEYAAVKARNCFAVSPEMDLKDAISEPLRGIVTTVRAAAPEAGDYGVVFGCGPMGLWCIQVLAGKMLAGLIAVDRDPEKLKLALKYGATHAINNTEKSVEESVAKITKGHMADFAIEGTGQPQLLAEVVKALRSGRGRIAVMSYYGKKVPELDFRPFSDKGAVILNPHNAFSANMWDDTRRAVELMNKGNIKTAEFITHRYKLSETQKAFEDLAARPKGFVKGVIYPNEK